MDRTLDVIALPAPMRPPAGFFRPFTSSEWIYEIRFDGYRCMAGVDGQEVQLRTAAGRDCAKWYSEVSDALRKLPGGPYVFDGELCVTGKRSAFVRLQGRTRPAGQCHGSPRVTLCVFDLLVYNGKPQMHEPLAHRKSLLKGLLAHTSNSPVLYVEHVEADADLIASIGAAGLPMKGFIAKRLAGQYHPGMRSDDWRKIDFEFSAP